MLHYFGYQVDAPPFCKYGQLDSEGKRTVWFDVPLRTGIFMHDFAVTQDYAIFIDHPLVFDGKRTVKEHKLPFVFKKELGTRVGLLPTSAKSAAEMQWFDLPPHAMIHVGNAWQADGKVHVYACCYKEFSLDLDHSRFGELLGCAARV